ncbi:class GN sortase [Pelagibius litoralis]|uniref:Class GN sortase n=1 Tax=Pelagibius litoralis TaxID=374515 RepID=A0A967KEE1_9PROT|nr:class GN sortase [Pelagibius litoralis]
MTGNRLLLGVALLFLGLGLWQLGGAGLIQGKAWLAQRLLDRAWADTLAGADAVKPWPWADTWPVARLQVAALDIDLFVLAGASGRSLAFGPGQVEGTEALNHNIMGGHRDTHFAFLQHLEEGHRFRLQDRSGAWQSYVVRGQAILDVRQEVIARPGRERQLLTLVTCYPFDAITPGGPLRYAVTAEAIPGEAVAVADEHGPLGDEISLGEDGGAPLPGGTT